MGRTLRLWRFAAVVVCMLILSPLPAVGAVGSFVQPTMTSAADQQLLAAVGLQPSDVQPSAQIVPYRSGTQVRGQVSLDLCGAAFPSEALRTGRRQVGINLQQAQVLSVETILYRNDAAAKQAMTELARARKTCPKGYAPPRVAGEPPIKNHFNHVPSQYRAAVPGVQRAAFDITESTANGDSGEVLSIYQRRGRIIVGLYSGDPSADTAVATNIGGVPGLANTLAQRLQATQTPATAV
jgi:hypothetical protein